MTVTDGGWDTHTNNFKSLKDSRIPPVDQALPQLLIDLEERGLLDTTLVLGDRLVRKAKERSVREA